MINILRLRFRRKDRVILDPSLCAKVHRVLAVKNQLGWFRYVVFLLAKVTRRLFDPYGQPSYSQFGEDRIIESFFLGQEQGVYVDVGCNHPMAYSNTWKLYLKGWHGIGIDPNPDLISEFQKVRPRDVAIQKVVSNKREQVDFYISKTSSLISGIGAKTDGPWQRTRENSKVVPCKSVLLCDLLQEHKIPTRFELLSVDVEGHELEVLDSLDFNRYAPKMIVIEMHEFDLSSPMKSAVYEKLTEHGYRLTAYLGPTGIFCGAASYG